MLLTTLDILPRWRLTQLYTPTGRDILISISDPNQSPPVISGFLAQDNYHFYDINRPLLHHGQILYPINASQAETIVAFIEAYRNRAEHLIVQCEAGISRSAGVAAALAEIFNLTPTGTEIFECGRYIPNSLAYTLVLNAGERIQLH